jgi:triosephosphate isomerase
MMKNSESKHDCKLIVANWKMNHRRSEASIFATKMKSWLAECPIAGLDSVEAVVCPPFTLLAQLSKDFANFHNLSTGAQDVSFAEDGAYTGDISAAMVEDCGADYAILGHSERRIYHNESDAIINAKAKLAQNHGLTPIICVGESEEERTNGNFLQIVADQINAVTNGLREDFVIAYEPIWAIGSGKIPTLESIAEMHLYIKGLLSKCGFGAIKIIYGGSVKPNNSREIMMTQGVDGVLVGGASLLAEDFIAIILAAESVGDYF